MARSPVECVDVFHGNGAVDLPTPRGIATAWNWLKAQVGNTHPGACLPFGMVSACAYSGAYPSGYGLYGPSFNGPAPRQFEQKTAIGFTHFQQSGTGDIRAFYNYLRVTPFAGSLDQLPARWDLEGERGRPGYYAARLKGTGIQAELTVAPKVALHRYTFQGSEGAGLAIDLTAGGLMGDAVRVTRPSAVSIQLVSDTAAAGKVVMDGIPICFWIETDTGMQTSDLWSNQRALGNARTLDLSGEDLRESSPLGVVFKPRAGEGHQVVLRIGFSFRSTERARANLRATGEGGFDWVAAQAYNAWEQVLDRVRVTGGSAAQREIFYSALYHSFIKPIDCENESPYWAEDTPFYLGFATLWDMYKTQLPLVMTVCAEIGREIVQGMLCAIEQHGHFPTAYLMQRRDFDQPDNQASGLAHHTLADGFVRGLEGVDWERAKRLMAMSLSAVGGQEFIDRGWVKPYSQTLDLAGAAYATALVARRLGDRALWERMLALSGNWRNVFDAETGRLGRDSRYYEGTLWNYSFRLLPDMAGRIGLYGGSGAFVEDLDRFFGYVDVASGVVDPNPGPDEFQKQIRPDRFEGLNNQSDMASPYAYVYAGRHDRTAEVVRTVLKYHYATGEGGLPGNDDSGGLSSWYVWNALGLFPVAGQDLYLIGSPIFESSTLHLSGGPFQIQAQGGSDESIYVQSATLNGEPLDRAWLRVGEVAAGGVLVLRMGPEPSAWGSKNLPRG